MVVPYSTMAGTAKKNTSNMYRFIAENIIQKRTQWVFFVIFHWLWHGLAWPVRPSAQRQEVCLDFAAGRGRSSCISERFGAKVVINGDNVVRCLKYRHTYIHTCLYSDIYIFSISIYVRVCVCACARGRVRARLRVHVRVYVFVCILCVCVFVCVRVCGEFLALVSLRDQLDESVIYIYIYMHS